MQVVRDAIYGPDLEMAQADAIDVLAVLGQSRIGELATALRVDTSTATRTADRLVAAGLAERVRIDGDGRGVALRITAPGRRIHGEMAARAAAVLGEILAPFTGDDREQLAQLLERLVASVDSFAAARSGS